MPNFNQVILIGHLCRDIELKSIASGSQVGQFSIAINHKYKTAAGEAREEVTFVDCEAWGKTAENLARFHAKGDAVMLRGRLKQDNWEDKATGQKRSKLKVVVDDFTFVKTRGEFGDDRQPAAQPAQAGRPTTRPAPRATQHTPADDADIPF